MYFSTFFVERGEQLLYPCIRYNKIEAAVMLSDDDANLHMRSSLCYFAIEDTTFLSSRFHNTLWSSRFIPNWKCRCIIVTFFRSFYDQKPFADGYFRCSFLFFVNQKINHKRKVQSESSSLSTQSFFRFKQRTLFEAVHQIMQD